MRRFASNNAADQQIRVYRSAAFVTGSAGTWTHLSYDATSSLETALGFTLSSGRIVVPTNGRVNVGGIVSYNGKLLLLQFAIRVVLEPVGGGGDVVQYEFAKGALTSGGEGIPFAHSFSAATGDKVRVDVRGVGAGSVSLDVGDANTWLLVTG